MHVITFIRALWLSWCLAMCMMLSCPRYLRKLISAPEQPLGMPTHTKATIVPRNCQNAVVMQGFGKYKCADERPKPITLSLITKEGSGQPVS
jgi:hypothetical protein